MSDTTRLLFSPYHPPSLRRVDRAFYLYRDCEVRITSRSDGRIPWPKCIPVDVRSRPILLVTDELLRAIREESSLALQHWFGVGPNQVWSWRRAFGVGAWEPEGSARLHRMNAAKGADGVKRKRWTPAELEAKRESAIRLDLIRFAHEAGNGRPAWTKQELVLLGTAPDAEVAARIGRTANAVRVKRTKLRIPSCKASWSTSASRADSGIYGSCPVAYGRSAQHLDAMNTEHP
jgi:hypothetical protein